MASTRHLTILLTDIKGFTDKTSHQTRAQIVDMLERHKAVVQPVLEGRGGRLVKTIGDAYLMAYDSPTDAVLAGIAVQEALRAHNEGRAPQDRIEVRIAINCGEVTLADNDVFGEPVNITARIEAVAEAGEVFFTEAVYLSMNKAEVPSSEVGLLQLKGIPEKIRVYKVKRETPLGQNAAPPPSGTGLRDAAPKAVFAAAGAAAAAVAAVAGKTAQAANARATGAGMQPVISCGAIPKVWRRSLAILVDFTLCGVVTEMIFSKGSPKFGFWLVWMLYSLLCLKKIGTTVGGRVCKLAVVRMDGQPLEKGDRMTRSLFSLISGWALGIGYAWALWEKDGRGWHDLMAGTRVVELDR
jgi:class 3 adenylate cyclase